MDDIDSVRMDGDERDDFLGWSGTGVISLASSEGDSPHAIPVSYGYDPVDGVFYFRLAAESGREKGELDGRAVTFVTYGEHDERWKSVVARGHLVSTTDELVSTEAMAGLERIGTIPLVDVFGEPTSHVGFEFYRLDPEGFTTRIERAAEP